MGAVSWLSAFLGRQEPSRCLCQQWGTRAAAHTSHFPQAAGKGLQHWSAACTAPGPLCCCLPHAQAALLWAPAAWLCPCPEEMPSPQVSALTLLCCSPALGSAGKGSAGRSPRAPPAWTSRCLRRAVGLQQSHSKTLLLFLSFPSLLSVLVFPLSPPASSLSCSYESSAEILPHTPRLTHFPTVSGSPASLADSMQQKLSCPRRRRQQSPSAM